MKTYHTVTSRSVTLQDVVEKYMFLLLFTYELTIGQSPYLLATLVKGASTHKVTHIRNEWIS